MDDTLTATYCKVHCVQAQEDSLEVYANKDSKKLYMDIQNPSSVMEECDTYATVCLTPDKAQYVIECLTAFVKDCEEKQDVIEGEVNGNC